MAIFEIKTFASFVGLLLAARKLVDESNSLDRLKALSDLATNTKALNAVLSDSGLKPHAIEMERQAKAALNFTHPGPARDDAEAIFWQVAPTALSDSIALTTANLAPHTACDRMVTAIKASNHGHDFTERLIYEQYFRAVTIPLLQTMLANPAYMTDLTPALWRETLERHGITLKAIAELKEDTAEILMLVRELHQIKQTTVPEDTLIAMARKIRPKIADRDEALRELENVVDLAAEGIARREAGSIVEAFVDTILKRLAEQTAKGDIDTAAAEADNAVSQAEAGLTELLNAAIRQHLLAYEAEGAAKYIFKRIENEATHPDQRFTILHSELRDRVDVNAASLQLEVAASLARTALQTERDQRNRNILHDYLGRSLMHLGERQRGTKQLVGAETAMRSALAEFRAGQYPEDRVAFLLKLANSIAMQGEINNKKNQIRSSFRFYASALKELKKLPLSGQRVAVLTSYAASFGAISKLEDNRARKIALLDTAKEILREALEIARHISKPYDITIAEMDLGNALAELGQLKSDITDLREAIFHYDISLEGRPREQMPNDWANTRANQALAYADLAALLKDPEMAISALAQLTEAVEILRANEHVWAENFAPRIPWIVTLITRLSTKP